VAVTAYAMQGDREKIMTAGFDGYLSKPVSSGSLVQELDRLLAHSDTQRAASTQSCENQGSTSARAIANQAGKP